MKQCAKCGLTYDEIMDKCPNCDSNEIRKALSMGSREQKALTPESMGKPNKSDTPALAGRGGDSPDELPNE